MIQACGFPVRNQYLIKTNENKVNNTPLNANDYMNVGYMAGRFGINLQNPNEPNPLINDANGTYATINSCCAPLFEANLANAGIKFNKLA